ncbi:MAG: alpha-2-macroglobulin family protein, partial [Myxococcota bacterium]
MTISTSFPPPSALEAPEPPADHPVQVTRLSPEGEVTLAPHVSVSFDQPMIALGSHESAVTGTPLRLAPELEGQTRWLGSRTLVFETENRLPMATTFHASLDPDLRSATGAALSEEVKWTFSTPPPGIVSFWPNDWYHVNPADVPVVMVFDQRVDAREILSRLIVGAGDADERVPLRLVTEPELEPFADAAALARDAEQGRLVAFKAVDSFPVHSRVKVVLPAGTPSAEGPRVTERDQTHRFRTHGPFAVRSDACSRPLYPGGGFSLRFSNPIDPESAEEPESVSIDPELPTQSHRVTGDYLYIAGISKPNTTYTLRLSPELRDVFGQTLGESPPIVCEVGDSPPILHSTSKQMVVLDPSAPPSLAVQTQGTSGLRITATSAEPRNWESFLTWQRHQTDVQPGRLLRSWETEVTGDPNEIATTLVDLSEVLPGGYGHVLLRVRLSVPPEQAFPRRNELRMWVQRTRIGLTVQHSDGLHVRATRLPRGEPLPGVSVYLLNPAGAVLPPRTTTRSDGRATLDLGGHTATFLMARLGDDLAMLPSIGASHSPVSGWRNMGQSDLLSVYLTNDRQMYKAGERAHFKGWVRRIQAGPRGDLEGVREGVVTWEAADPRGSMIGGGEAPVDRFGGFDFHLDIPENANNGTARVIVKVDSNGLVTRSHERFQIEAFRRPTFELTTTLGEAPHILGEQLNATLEAAYYSGEPLPHAEVSWSVGSQPASYRPPGHAGFAFGSLQSFMGWHVRHGRHSHRSEILATHAGTTDGEGVHTLGLDLAGGPRFPSTITLRGSVTDVDRQTWTSTTQLLVHPAELYVGLALPRRFVSRGEDLEVEAIVTDVDGAVAPGRIIDLTAERWEWRQRQGGWEQHVVETKSCQATSATDPASCVFESLEGGWWRITAEVADRRGRSSRSEIGCWVSGAPLPPQQNARLQRRVELLPDKDEYAPGDVARVLAVLPFHPADLTVTVARGGILSTQHVRVESPDHVIEVPIDEGLAPGAYVRVAATGAEPRTRSDGEPDPSLPPIPAASFGATYLSVPPIGRNLSVLLETEQDEVAPGQSTSLRLTVSDAGGMPVENAQVLVVVVDDSVLSLTGHRLSNPMDCFYARRFWAVGHLASHSMVLRTPLETEIGSSEEHTRAESLDEGLGRSAGTRGVTLGMGGLGTGNLARGRSGAPRESSPILLRSDLSALALFAPTVVTGSDGTAKVDLTLPDNVTRYRIMAVATDGAKRFGPGESTLTARLPLQARPSLPRFLTLGDQVELPVVLHNRSDEALTVSVAARAEGLEMTSASAASGGNGAGARPAGRRMQVSAGERVEVRFPAVANRMGPARVQVAAAAGDLADAAEVTIPVWAPLATETFATYGTVDQGAVLQPVAIPEGARTDTGALELTTSSTELHSLTDAVLSLWGSSRQLTEPIASRVLAAAALTDVLDAFEAGGLPPPGEIREAVGRDLRLLAARQLRDGSFNMWGHWDVIENRWPYLAVYVGLALAVADEKGFDVPARMLERIVTYLQNIQHRIPSSYSHEGQWAIRSAALYVLWRMGLPDLDEAEALLREAGRRQNWRGRRAPGRLGLESEAFLLVLASEDPTRFAEAMDRIERNLHNALTETA